MGWCASVSYSGVRAFMRCLTPWDFMTHIFQSRMFRAVVAASVSALALTGVAWANRSSDLQQKISETLNDSNLDADAVNENVHIMANNAEVDDQSAAKVCS